MYSVLVTGVGAIIGYGVLRSLRMSGYGFKVIGTDIYPDAVGRQWCDKFVQVPRTDSSNFAEKFTEIISSNNIDIVIPAIEQDVSHLSSNRQFFKCSNVALCLNQSELIRISDDKWLMHQELEQLGLLTIKTEIDGSFEELSEILGLPFLLKPRRSYASKGILKISDELDFNYWRKKLGSNFMVQEIVGSDDSEYTVASFGFGDGTTSETIILRRKLSGEGATAKAWVVPNESEIGQALSLFVNRLAIHFKPVGPTNYQFRYHNDQPMLLEINPRISSSTSIRASFGFNEAKMCLDFFLEKKRPQPIKILMGSALRYIEDCIEYDCNNI